MPDQSTILLCPTCGGPVPLSGRSDRQRIFCSWTCGNAAKVHPKGPRPDKWETRTCPVDGKQFAVRHYKPYRFCSKKCGAAVAPRRPIDPAKWGTGTCLSCGIATTFPLVKPKTYCSMSCRTRDLMVKTGRTTRREMTCEQCGGPRMASPCFEGRRFCSRECMGRWMSEHVVGEAHPMWRGGPQPYYGASWPSARRAVRNRDKVCQSCGIGPAALGSALDVHHLASFRDFGPERHKEANDHDNLVALCRPCHIKMEWATHWREPAD